MKTSELIDELESIVEENGDLDVAIDRGPGDEVIVKERNGRAVVGLGGRYGRGG